MSVTADQVTKGVDLLASIIQLFVNLFGGKGEEMTEEEARAYARAAFSRQPIPVDRSNDGDLADLADDGELNGSAQ